MTNFIIRLFILNKKNDDPAKTRNRYGFVGGSVGVFCNVLLFLIKLLAGFLTGSVSVMADAFNNLSDAASSVVALLGFKLSNMPADKEHPFGHGRFEYIAGFIVSVVIIIVGVELFKTSIKKIFDPVSIRFTVLPVVIMVFSIVVKFWMYMFYRKMGATIDSATLRAAARDSLNDVVATTAIIIGMLIYQILGYNLDGYIGFAVACFIIYGGIMTAKETLDPLLGQGPDADFVKNIEEETLCHEGIYGVHDIIVHSYGPSKILVSLHAEVSCSADILEIHNLIDSIEKHLAEKFRCEAVIHMDPVETMDAGVSQMKNIVKQVVASVDQTLSIHDFRLIHSTDKTDKINKTNKTNKIEMEFDVAAPFKHILSDEKLKEEISKGLSDFNNNYKAIIHIDRTF